MKGKLKDHKSQRKFNSKFANNEELKKMVDSVTKENFDEVRQLLISFIEENFRTKERDVARVRSKNTPQQLQLFYYSYVLTSNGLKVIK